jgi:two-component system chemotaxis response regulator CheB
MDGLTFLRKLMEYHPMPVIVISSLGQASCKAALEALQSGAVEVLAKPGGPYSVGELRLVLAAKIRAAAAARLRTRTAERPATQPVRKGLMARPEGFDLKKVIANFSRAFAERLDRICQMAVKEAADGDDLTPGVAPVAPGDYHMLLRKRPGGYFVCVKDGPRVCYQKPSVDVMFRSVAEAAKSEAVGVLLTGMGSDGAAGMLQMKQAGAQTIAQDEASCVVFGMPREAIRMGAADHVQPLANMAGAILSAVRAKSPAKT